MSYAMLCYSTLRYSSYGTLWYANYVLSMLLYTRRQPCYMPRHDMTRRDTERHPCDAAAIRRAQRRHRLAKGRRRLKRSESIEKAAKKQQTQHGKVAYRTRSTIFDVPSRILKVNAAVPTDSLEPLGLLFRCFTIDLVLTWPFWPRFQPCFGHFAKSFSHTAGTS